MFNKILYYIIYRIVLQFSACGALSAPANGTVSLSNDDLVESIATFSCDEGFVITGPQQLVCLSTGAWSESAPTCSFVGK